MQIWIGRECREPFAVGREDIAKLLIAQLRRAGDVLVRFDDDLVPAKPRESIEERRT
jgi:hypothetical protein